MRGLKLLCQNRKPYSRITIFHDKKRFIGIEKQQVHQNPAGREKSYKQRKSGKETEFPAGLIEEPY
jgi:hypothetical protein